MTKNYYKIINNLIICTIAYLFINKSYIYGSNPLLTKFNTVIKFNEIKGQDINEAVITVLSISDSIIKDILYIENENRTFKNTILPMDNIYNNISKIWNPIELLASVSNNINIRSECNKASLKISNYFIHLYTNIYLYNAILSYSNKQEAKLLIEPYKRFMLDELREFENSGLGLSHNSRDTLINIQNRISKLIIEYTNNLYEDNDTTIISERLMEGLTPQYKKERYIKGNYVLDLSYPSFYQYMENAKSDSMRKILRKKFLNKGMPNNIKILNEILLLRSQFATLLGYPTYAHYSMHGTMAKKPSNVWKFEYDLLNKIQNKADLDTKEMLGIKNNMNGSNDTIIYDWEKYYYENHLLKSKYSFNKNKVREYFKLGNVINGIFEITGHLFGINYIKINNPSVWDPGVTMYELRDDISNDLIGTFYLDLFPRKNKYQHAAVYTIYSGKKVGLEYQLPISCLVCNFPEELFDYPSLLSHEEVETFFHEFGHLLHDLLTKAELSSQAGTSVSMDFVEAPAQMLESLVWNKDALKIFARHYVTNEVMPDILLEKLIATRSCQLGNDILQQIFYGILDLSLHDTLLINNNFNSTDLMIEYQNNLTHYPYVHDTNQLASFDHLIDYSASYYGYLWSEVYAADMFSEFTKNGIKDKKTGMRFRKVIFEKGGSLDPMILVKEFIEREPSIEAYFIKLGL